MTIGGWSDLWQMPMTNSAIFTHGWVACGPQDARLLARPILQEYDAFTVDLLTWIAARHNLVEIAEACRKEAKYSQWLGAFYLHPANQFENPTDY